MSSSNPIAASPRRRLYQLAFATTMALALTLGGSMVASADGPEPGEIVIRNYGALVSSTVRTLPPNPCTPSACLPRGIFVALVALTQGQGNPQLPPNPCTPIACVPNVGR